MGDEGLEPSTPKHSNGNDLQAAAKCSAALGAVQTPILSEFDPELATVIGAWSTLSPETRAVILGMVRTEWGAK